MKRLLLVALVGLAAAFPLAFAQEEEAAPFFGGGFSVTFIGGNTLSSITVQGGADDLIGSAALRANFDIGLSSGIFGFGADVLADFPSDEISPYVGGGIGFLTGGGTIFEVHGTGGLEFFVADQGALFAELQPKLYISGGTTFGANLRFGFNYYID